MKALLLFSGPLAVGKSSVAKVLEEQFGFRPLKSSGYLRQIADRRGTEHGRAQFQDLGDELDEETDFRWLVDEVALPAFTAHPEQDRWFIDSVRKPRQVEHFRERFGDSVAHVHFWAPEEVLERRYSARKSLGGHLDASTGYEEAVQHLNEQSSRSLKRLAQVVLDLSTLSSARAAATLHGLANGIESEATS